MYMRENPTKEENLQTAMMRNSVGLVRLDFLPKATKMATAALREKAKVASYTAVNAGSSCRQGTGGGGG